ncbi:MAG: enolase C-terminal domain-like protein [Pseudomonadota bacterium]
MDGAKTVGHTVREMAVHVVHIPARATHSHGTGDVAGINAVLLELTTESGLTGWGEASPWPVFTGTVEANVAALHTHLRPVVVGANPVAVEPTMAAARARLVGHTEAMAALECALLDLCGQIAGLPIAELLGGRHRATIPLSFSIANPDFEADLEDVAALWADGVRLFKVKTGFAGHAFDLMRLERLRARYGAEIDLRVDYNQGLPAPDAIRTVRDLEAFRPTFVEQPVKRHERAALAAITAAVDVPIMADEAVFGPDEALIAADLRLCDIISLKVAKSGGARRALYNAAIAEAAGMGVYGGCMFETSIAHAAGAHLMAAVGPLTLGCEFYMSTYYATVDIAEAPFPVAKGAVIVPTAPGLGVRPDAQKLAAHRTAVYR